MCFLPQFAAAEPTAQEILNRSKEAMAPPIQFRVRTGGVDTIVYQKMRSDGLLAIRTETLSPIETTRIVVGEQSYEIYPKTNILVDTSFMFQTARVQVRSISAPFDDKSYDQVFIKGMTTRGEKDCFEIESTISSNVRAKLETIMPAGTRSLLPHTRRFLIDKETFDLVQTEAFSQSGKSLTRSEIFDIVRDPPLEEALFLPPDGIEVKTPTSVLEHVAIIKEAFQPSITPQRLDLNTIPIPKPELLGPVEIDLKTGRAIPPVPQGMSLSRFEELVGTVREAKGKESAASRDYRMIGIYFTLLAIIVLSGLIVLRQLRLRYMA